jgi:TolB protein
MTLLPLCLLAAGVGIFDGNEDIGVNPKAGSIEFANNEYRITGGGANVWGAQDAFRFAWRRLTGDVTIAADVQFLGKGVNPHRKALLMIRQDLTADSAYADLALHGDGSTALQFRAKKGGPTEEVKSTITSPLRLRLERRGNRIAIFAGPAGQEPAAAGTQVVEFSGPVYAGIGVCSHDAAVLETALFTNVHAQQPTPNYRSRITVFDLASRKTEVAYTADQLIEAPNWSRDGKFLLINTLGDLYRLPLDTRKPEKIVLGAGGYRCNNDHDLTRDGRLLAFSASSATSRQSQVYVANADGSNVRLLTPPTPSYFHSWSPDAKWLAFVAQRNNIFHLYRVSVDGGPELPLTTAGPYDDGPDYTADGKWIYFNSQRGGNWDVWRMPADGAGPNDVRARQVTNDPGEDWFPHPSPNGKWMLVFTFPPGTVGHNDRMNGVQLRLAKLPGNKLKPVKPETIHTFFGGQGTINVNSWSPDSKKFAFVAYEVLPAR